MSPGGSIAEAGRGRHIDIQREGSAWSVHRGFPEPERAIRGNPEALRVLHGKPHCAESYVAWKTGCAENRFGRACQGEDWTA